MQTLDTADSKTCNRKKRWLAAVLLSILLSIAMLSAGVTEASLFWDRDETVGRMITITIDPGHGGYDTGASGPDASLEKNITLQMARALKREFKSGYKIVLTRNGDYHVALTRRASIANQNKSDLFISLHTGGSSRYETHGWSIFFYQSPEQNGGDVHPESSSTRPMDGVLQWDLVCNRHQKESKTLAGCIKTQLSNHPDIPVVNVSGAALRVLEGLNMPAIIIEMGYVTHPTTEKRLHDPAFLTDIARRIKRGVDIYLTR